MELLTGLLFVLSAYWYLWPFDELLNGEQAVRFVIAVYLSSVLIAATFIDIDFRIIPDELTISGIILSLLVSLLFPSLHRAVFPGLSLVVNGLAGAGAGILVGGGSVYLVGVIGKLIFRKDAMGMGDVKLMAFLGGFLGWDATLYIFLVACFLGSIVGIVLYFITKDHYIAFGPYIAMAAIVVMFLKQSISYLMFHGYPEFIRNLLLV